MSSAAVTAPPTRLVAPRSRPSATQQQQREVAASGEGRRPDRPASMDPLSDKATLVLIRRILCPQKLSDKGRDVVPPIEDLLPSLTSRNDVDLQLYALLAIIVREFVQSWYSKITPDETFVAEVLQVIAHCTRALEQRFRAMDLESLVLDEIPDLLDRHITAYRTSHSPVSQEPVAVNPRQVYHALCPLPQLSPVPEPGDGASIEEQEENESAYRQLLVQAILATLLPTEDLENPCLTAIVGQILSELVIGNIIVNKASQPWLLYESICISARILEEKKARATQRMVSGTHTSPVTLKTEAKWTTERIKWSAQAVLLTLVHLSVLVFSSVRLLITTLVASSALPLRQKAVGSSSRSGDTSGHSKSPDGGAGDGPAKVPVLSFRAWQCVGNLVGLDHRMPWVSGFLSWVQYQAIHGPGALVGLNSPLDRLFSHHIQQLLSVSHLPDLLRTLRGVLFPNNNPPGKSSLVPPPSDEEFVALRKRAADALLGLIPGGVARVYFGNGERARMVDDVEGLLMVINDQYCNKHLMYSLLELVLVRLMPELSSKSVEELWEERLC